MTSQVVKPYPTLFVDQGGAQKSNIKRFVAENKGLHSKKSGTTSASYIVSLMDKFLYISALTKSKNLITDSANCFILQGDRSTN